jgi:hypothetical protein
MDPEQIQQQDIAPPLAVELLEMAADFAAKGWSSQVLARCCTANCRTSATVLITVEKRNLPCRVTGADICMLGAHM